MEYNYSDTSDVPNLLDFKERLVKEILHSVFFQEKSGQKYNMLKLPIISAPRLIRKQVNNDVKKKTIMEKEFNYTEETLKTFMELVDGKELKINRISDLTLPELKVLSGEIMKIDLINLSKIFLAGQVCFCFLLRGCNTTTLGCIGLLGNVTLTFCKVCNR